jgi:hypothetical protein
MEYPYLISEKAWKPMKLPEIAVLDKYNNNMKGATYAENLLE